MSPVFGNLSPSHMPGSIDVFSVRHVDPISETWLCNPAIELISLCWPLTVTSDFFYSFSKLHHFSFFFIIFLSHKMGSFFVYRKTNFYVMIFNYCLCPNWIPLYQLKSYCHSFILHSSDFLSKVKSSLLACKPEQTYWTVLKCLHFTGWVSELFYGYVRNVHANKN